ncbi:Peptidyl-prolyl cis-trans isomerase CWC27 like protein [Eufriesea mexicana]|uniref:Peptidyl-prolyl cis-trans isomerase CWC27 like protein n=1 Tax=Eufriesea mexicana TaxID=516756 RepID=A0A310S4S2_9HYME|nr:Peptidyl-prolyl cis-trans isomerase CWC27 like protein [Eufriesea mexicana]
MEGYWDDTIFHTQGGDPTGTGEGGKIYGEPFKDKFHTRLRFCRRDLIAMAMLEKGKSAHDHLTDPKLSSQPAVEPPGLENKKRKEDHSSDWESDDEVETQEELEVSNEGKDKKYTRDTKKEPKKVQNYKIDDVEDDKVSISAIYDLGSKSTKVIGIQNRQGGRRCPGHVVEKDRVGIEKGGMAPAVKNY